MMKIVRWHVAHTWCWVATVTFSIFASAPAHSREKVLYSFCSQQGCSDGAAPGGGLISDESGNLYGTTYFGGQVTDDCANLGLPCGVVFKLAPDGTETVLHTFTGPDGGNPRAGLVADTAGNLYGTTIVGGNAGQGTVFKLAPDGTETVLHSFKGGSDGSEPASALFRDKRGNLFGTTLFGGSSDTCEGSGCGTVFEVKPDGKEKVLYAFTGGADGGMPIAGVTEIKGNIYGTTTEGGETCEGHSQGCGTIFKLTLEGTETVLHAFTGGSDGIDPWGTPIADKDGNLYGTTLSGGGGIGCGGDCGTIFKVAPDGTETVLYAFQGGSDGAFPQAGLVADKVGNFFGTTDSGGRSCKKDFCGGTVFKLAVDGSETVLYAFGSKKGDSPGAALYIDKKGVLLGTASLGAAHNEGAVFRITQ